VFVPKDGAVNELHLFAGAAMKTCSKCAAALPLSAFYLRKDNGKPHSACKACERAATKVWYDNNRDKAIAKYKAWRLENLDTVRQYRRENREKHYRQEVSRKYGVSVAWLDKALADQGNKCACCGREFVSGDKQTTPHVDHCHKSGQVRGVLCNRCNSVLGLCEDSTELLSSLLGYLKCHG
jgi:hypothetical protein